MSPMPIASVTLAPQPASSFARKAGSPPPGSPATSTRSTLDAGEIDVPLRRPLDQIGGVGGRQDRRFGPEQLDRLHQALGVPGAERDVAEADPVEGLDRRARDERARVVGGDRALARGDARGRVAARRARHPVVEIARRQRDVARRPGGAARRVDPDDLGRRRAEVRADRIVGSAGRLRARLFSVRGSRAMSASPPAASAEAKPACGQLLAIEGRAVEEVGELRCDRTRRRGRAARPTGRVSTLSVRTRPPPRQPRPARIRSVAPAPRPDARGAPPFERAAERPSRR